MPKGLFCPSLLTTREQNPLYMPLGHWVCLPARKVKNRANPRTPLICMSVVTLIVGGGSGETPNHKWFGFHSSRFFLIIIGLGVQFWQKPEMVKRQLASGFCQN